MLFIKLVKDFINGKLLKASNFVHALFACILEVLICSLVLILLLVMHLYLISSIQDLPLRFLSLIDRSISTTLRTSHASLRSTLRQIIACVAKSTHLETFIGNQPAFWRFLVLLQYYWLLNWTIGNTPTSCWKYSLS